MRLTNLPLQTARIEARTTSIRIFFSRKDVKSVHVPRPGSTLWELVCIVGDEWKFVEHALQGCRQREDAAALGCSIRWRVMGGRLVARITVLVIVGHRSPSREFGWQ